MLISSAISTALIVLMIISGIILITKSTNKTGKWYGIFMIVSTGGYFVAILKTLFLLPLYPNSVLLKTIIYIIAITGYRICPYLYMMANLSYSKLVNPRTEKKIAYLLAIPILLLFIIDMFNVDIIHIVSVHHNRTFWMTSILELTYVFISYGLCVIPVFRKKNRTRKILTILANSIIIPVALYIYNIFPSSTTFWGNIILVFWAYFLIFTFLVIRFRILGFRLKLDNIESDEIYQLMCLLTDAEKDIFRHILNGKTKREIAEMKGVSILTVRNQISSIYKKLGIKDRQELVDRLTD